MHNQDPKHPVATIKSDDEIRQCAALVIEQLGPQSGISFGYNRESCAWIDDYIDCLRAASLIDDRTEQELVRALGCFLGECVIKCRGGRWKRERAWIGGNDSWLVFFDAGEFFDPFSGVGNKVVNGAAKHIERCFAKATLSEPPAEPPPQLAPQGPQAPQSPTKPPAKDGFFSRFFGGKRPSGFAPTGTEWDCQPWKTLFVYSDNLPSQISLMEIAKGVAADAATLRFPILIAVVRKFTPMTADGAGRPLTWEGSMTFYFPDECVNAAFVESFLQPHFDRVRGLIVGKPMVIGADTDPLFGRHATFAEATMGDDSRGFEVVRCNC